MLRKSFILYSVIALSLGAFVAAVPLRSNFSVLNKYDVQVDVVYVYLRAYNVTEEAPGLGCLTMVSYVVVLNITNLTDQMIEMRDITVSVAKTVIPKANGVTIYDSVVSLYRYLPQDDFTYFWQPGVSRLLVLTGVRETSDYYSSLSDLKSALEVEGRTEEGAFATSHWVIKPVKLEVLSPGERVYDTIFGTHLFDFTDDGVGLMIER